MPMRIVAAVVVAVATGLACILLALILNALNVPPAEAVGHFLNQYAWVIGILFGLWYFATGGAWFRLGPPRA